MLAATLLAAILAQATPPAAAPPTDATPLKVAVTENRPFAWSDPKGRWHGLSAQLWEEICEEEGIRFEFIPYPTIGDAIDAIERGEADAGAVPSAPTASRLDKLEYTVPFELSNIRIASRIDRKATIIGLLEHLVAPPLPFLYLTVALSVIVLGVAVRIVERRGKHREHLAHPSSTVGESMWWAAVTFFTVGYGDLVPKTAAGRALTVVAMAISAILLSLMTGAVGSAITIRSLRGVSAGPSDLDRMTCGAVRGSATHEWASRNGIPVVEFPTVEVALEGLKDGRVEAVLGEGIALRDAVVNLGSSGLVVDDVRFTRKALAFPLRLGFPPEVRRRLNRTLMAVSDLQTWRQSVERDLGIEEQP